MGKVISNILLFGLAIGLTIFTGSRTLDLLAQWLPMNQQIMQYLGLAAFEGGLYFWALYFVTAAKGSIQRGIALMMIVICFFSVAVATVCDLLLVGAESGKLPEIPTTQKQAIVIFVGIIIVANVAAFLAAKLTDPDKLKEFAVQDAEDTIHQQELAMIRYAAPRVAAQMAPLKTQQWVDSTWERMLPNTARPMQQIEGSINQYNQTGSIPAELPAPQQQDNLLTRLANAFQPRQDEQLSASTPLPSPTPGTFTLAELLDVVGIPSDHSLEYIAERMKDGRFPRYSSAEIADATGIPAKEVEDYMVGEQHIMQPAEDARKNVKRRTGN